jgi:ketosteroid isomerase-like protein
MITDADIGAIREGYDLINRGEVKTDLLADDFILEQAPGLPGTRGTFEGAAGMEASLRELLDGFDVCRFEPCGFDVHGDWVVVPVRWFTSVRGIEQATEIVHLWQIRDGLAVRMRVLAGSADPLTEIAKLS